MNQINSTLITTNRGVMSLRATAKQSTEQSEIPLLAMAFIFEIIFSVF